jgi:hypothetical protein
LSSSDAMSCSQYSITMNTLSSSAPTTTSRTATTFTWSSAAFARPSVYIHTHKGIAAAPAFGASDRTPPHGHLSRAISRRLLSGRPAVSRSMRTFFSATTSPVRRSRARSAPAPGPRMCVCVCVRVCVRVWRGATSACALAPRHATPGPTYTRCHRCPRPPGSAFGTHPPGDTGPAAAPVLRPPSSPPGLRSRPH